MSTEAFQTGALLSEDVLIGALKNLASRQAQVAARVRVARGLLPAPPEAMVPALLYLSQDPEVEVKKHARQSLAEMPGEVLWPVIQTF